MSTETSTDATLRVGPLSAATWPAFDASAAAEHITRAVDAAT